MDNTSSVCYNITIKFITVKNTDHVDQAVITPYHRNYKSYTEKLDANTLYILKTVSKSDSNSFIISDITVPEGTNAITFVNEATTHRIGCMYEVSLTYARSDSTVTKFVGCRRNQFTIIPEIEVCGSALESIGYVVGYTTPSETTELGEYTEDDCQVSR